MTLRTPSVWTSRKTATPHTHTASCGHMPHERHITRHGPSKPMSVLASDTHTGNDVTQPGVHTDVMNQAEQVMDAERDQSLIQQLDYATWLPFCAKAYCISPRIEDYVLVTTPICPSDLPNRNGIGFPLAELTKFQPPPISRMAYKAWAGTPVHLEHDNEDCTKAYGVVLDASLHKIMGYAEDQLWKVMGLLAIDKNKHPDIAQKVLTRELNTYSMGALVDEFSCSFCGTPIVVKVDRYGNKDVHGCHHVQGPEAVNWNPVQDPMGSGMHLAYLNAHSISPIEVSIVADPAWTTALSDTLLPSMAVGDPLPG